MEPLKEWYNAQFYKELSLILAEIYPPFQAEQFYNDAVENLGPLALKARMRRTTESCRRYLPADYRKAVEILYQVPPKIKGRFAGIFLPDFVEMYGLDDFDFSLEALKYFTPYFSAEFAVRRFLKKDFAKTIGIMVKWSEDENHHVRRLASEGSRPRLPWSFQLDMLVANPKPVAPILENLKADPELYVKKSVANHLNDISKDHPEWMLDWVSGWGQSSPHTAWIIKRAARSLIKAGHPRAFALFGFEANPQIEVSNLQVSQAALQLGQTQTFSFNLASGKKVTQKLVIDYKVHYVKKNKKTQPKVFKLKEIDLPANQTVTISKSQVFKNFSTRVHYPGTHTIEVMINGRPVGQVPFELVVPQ